LTCDLPATNVPKRELPLCVKKVPHGLFMAKPPTLEVVEGFAKGGCQAARLRGLRLTIVSPPYLYAQSTRPFSMVISRA
jgi:hypothetical protein